MEVPITPLRADPDISHLRHRLGTVKDQVEQLTRRICDLEEQGLSLAKSPGFETIYTAQAFINFADDPTPYKQLAERVEGLQNDLSRERKDNDKLRAEVEELRAERNVLRAKIGISESRYINLRTTTPRTDHLDSPLLSTLNATHHSPAKWEAATLRQLHDLQRRYDELQTVKQRADDRYKAGYRKFEALKAYLRSEKIQEMEERLRDESPNLTKDQRKSRRAEINSLKENKIEELEAAEQQDEINGDDTSALPFSSRMVINRGAEGHPIAVGGTLSEKNKENQQTPIPDVPKRRIYMGSMTAPSPIGVTVSQPSAKMQSTVEAKAPPLTKTTAVSSTPMGTASTRVPLHFEPTIRKQESLVFHSSWSSSLT